MLAVLGAPAHAQFSEALSVSERTANESKASQQRIDQLDNRTQELLNEYRANVKQLDSLQRYNASLERNIAAQEREIDRLQTDIDNVEGLQQATQPLMEDMVERFGEIVAADLPFLEQERGLRVDRLSGLLDDSSISAAQKYRLIVEAYQIENEYGRTIGAYEGVIEDDEGELTGEFLRVGRIALIFKTPDDSVLRIYDKAVGDFVNLNKGAYLQDVKFGLRMAKEQTAPDVFFVPVKPPASAQ